MARLRTMALIAAGAIVAAAGAALADETIAYTYDAQGRLIRVVHSGDVNNNVQANYTYDDADSRTNRNVTGSPTPPP